MSIGTDKITQIIGDYIEGTISSEDKKLLDSWLTDSANQRFFERLTSKHYLLSKDKQHQVFNSDKDAAWQATQQSIKSSKKVKLWMQYAAAVLVPLVLFFAVYQLSEVGQQRSDVASYTIEPGEQRAILILSDGSQIEVSAADTLITQSQSGVVIDLDSAAVNYNDLNNKESDGIHYNTLNTTRGMEYSITLEDGTKVWLNASSSLKYPERFVGTNREVYADGEVYFEVAKDRNRPFFVHFNNKKIRVLGTQFNVRSYKEENNDYVTLAEGSIQLESKQANVIMEPNKQAVVNKKSGQLELQTVNAMVYGAWRKGNFVYDKARLETIINDVARWYQLNVFYQNHSVKEKRLSLYTPRQGSIKDLLEILEATDDISFEINDDNLIVRSK
ncbi:FecR family protein [Carboxylicivirga sp. M1479]|uniref:FecR family protein n=1 Tax=Carboxylicivirga sp. M1479 TaxID=2594476 RepID=UPI0011773406|nr:FecR family protein [Carboxylicivirga sp. M1479]TRX71430.1 DUF4974 domain-containing protein [Carboxylicivirga sp. M1479]